MEKLISVYMWPKKINSNKYLDLLCECIENKGIQVKDFSISKLGKLKKGDVLHMHWPSFNYQSSNYLSTIARSIIFILMLIILKFKGIKVIWTVHNLYPHSKGKNGYDYIMRKVIMSFCNYLIAMGSSSKKEIINEYNIRKSKIIIVPHGHYRGIYEESNIDIRGNLNIPKTNFVFGFIGQISPYKGIDDLIASFKKINLENINLIIAGKPSADFDMQIIKNVNDSRIHTILEFIGDEEIVSYLKAFDTTVFPYKKVTTSGSVILSLSYNTPVIAPKKGLLEDYIPEECGILYEDVNEDSLKNAMEQMVINRQKNEKEFENKINELDWEHIGDRLVSIYKS